MRNRIWWVCGFLAALAGCSSSLSKPTLMAPGPVAYQQHQAERFDPYPDDTLGPAVVGGHPRDFAQPREPLPLRPNSSSAPPLAAAPAAAPVVVGRPVATSATAAAPSYAPSAYDSPYGAPGPFIPSTLNPSPTPQR